MSLIEQAAIIVHAYRQSTSPETWEGNLRIDYSLTGKQLRLQENSDNFLNRVIRSLSSTQAYELQRIELVRSIAAQIFAVFEEGEASDFSSRNTGWSSIGRWLASMPDAGEQALKILSTVASTTACVFQVPTQKVLVRHWSTLARAHLNNLMHRRKSSESLEVWSRLKLIAKKEPVNQLDLWVISQFFKWINTAPSHFRPLDIIAAVWFDLSDENPQQTIENYHRLAKHVDALDDRQNLLKAQDLDELTQQAQELERLKSQRSNLFYHPDGFRHLLEALYGDTRERVIPPPRVACVAPFLSFVELEALDVKWSIWQQEWLAEDPQLTKKLKAVVAIITARIPTNSMPDFNQWNSQVLAFSGDDLVSVHFIPWKDFDLFELEAFVWLFCQGSLKHYETFMKELGMFSHTEYLEQINRLKSMMRQRGFIEEAWIVDATACGLTFYDTMRTQIQTYLKRASSELQLPEDQAISLGNRVIMQMASHALRSNADEWLSAVEIELRQRPEAHLVSPSPMKKRDEVAASELVTDNQPVSDELLAQVALLHGERLRALLNAQKKD